MKYLIKSTYPHRLFLGSGTRLVPNSMSLPSPKLHGAKKCSVPLIKILHILRHFDLYWHITESNLYSLLCLTNYLRLVHDCMLFTLSSSDDGLYLRAPVESYVFEILTPYYFGFSRLVL
jgi:hypothetical protein